MNEIEALWAEARLIADRARERVTALESQRAQLDEQIKEARAFIRRVYPEPSKKAAPSPAPALKLVSSRKLLEIADLVDREFDDETIFAAPHVAAIMGVGTTDTIRKALAQLRDVEFVAKAGERRVEGQRAGKPHQHYRVLDRHAIDRLRRDS